VTWHVRADEGRESEGPVLGINGVLFLLIFLCSIGGLYTLSVIYDTLPFE
jgi:hypothetical protein